MLSIKPLKFILVGTIKPQTLTMNIFVKHYHRLYIICQGESVEENVKREVAEEVGLEVMDIKYFGSQHWAFPASRLMIGCLATVSEHQFSLDRSELEDAAWFTPQEVRGALNRVSNPQESVFAGSKELWVPPRGAIAHTLLKHWIATHHSAKL
ncbi:unnamed protein product [Timema podura]|uniref:NAD(+) diphosphatase n=1 Tax=Timema podura TaxID=61482 RepID=A0ABN7PRP6_TIMPD|nr:unnamed protein product [Timema podura]